jgi:hypothetical protein
MRSEGIAEVRGQIAEVKPFLVFGEMPKRYSSYLCNLTSDLCNVSTIE